MKFPNTLDSYARRLASLGSNEPVLTGPARGFIGNSPIIGGYHRYQLRLKRKRRKVPKRDLYVRKTLERVYKALIALYIALGYEDHRDPVRRARFERTCLSKVGRILISCTKNLSSTLKNLKRASHEARTAWCEHRPARREIIGIIIPHGCLNHITENQLLQVSYLGRALPCPPNPTWDLYRKYFDSLVEPFDQHVDPVLQGHIALVAREFRRYARKPHATLTGSSACAEYDRSSGGYSQAVRDLHKKPVMNSKVECKSIKTLMRQTSSSLYERKVLLKGFFQHHVGEWSHISDDQTSQRQGSDWRAGFSRMGDHSKKYAMDDKIHPGPVPDLCSQAIAVKETGFKYRFVTKSPRALVYYGHILRSKYYPCLSRYPTTSEGLFDQTRSFDLGTQYPLSKDIYVFSADLSRATDCLSFEAIDLVCHCLGIDPKYIREHPIRCECDGKSIRGTTKRGCFMGLPMSWTILSICHLAVCRTIYGPNGLCRARIRGDDLIALMSLSEIAEYKRLMGTLGFEVNHKSFLSKDRGIFCEKAYALNVRNGHYFLDEVESVFSLRFITKSLDQYDPSTGNMFTFLSAGKSCWGIQRKTPYWRRLMYFSFGYLIRQSRQKGLDPFLPTMAGGLGFPPNDMGKRPSSLSQACLTFLHNSRKRVNLLYDSATKSELDEKVQRFMKRVESCLEFYPEGGSGAIKLCDADFAPLIGLCANYLLYEGSSVQPKKPSLRHHLAKFGEARTRIINSSRGIKPLRWTYRSAYDLFDRLKPSLASVQELVGHDPDLLERMGCPSFFPLYGKYDPAKVRHYEPLAPEDRMFSVVEPTGEIPSARQLLLAALSAPNGENRFSEFKELGEPVLRWVKAKLGLDIPRASEWFGNLPNGRYSPDMAESSRAAQTELNRSIDLGKFVTVCSSTHEEGEGS